MKRVCAYSFDSPMTLPAILARLNELGPWRWIERDNDRWGEYISTRALAEPDRGMIKILSDDGLFVVTFVLEADPEKLDAVCNRLLTCLLAGIGATTLTCPTEPEARVESVSCR